MQGRVGMALIAAESPAATPIPNPPVTVLHVLARSLAGQLFPLDDDGSLFEIRIAEFETHVGHTDVLEAQVAVDIHTLPWHVDLVFSEFVIALAAYFPSYSAYLHQSPIFYAQLSDLLASNLHYLSLQAEQDQYLAFFAPQLLPYSELFLAGLHYMQELLLALADQAD